jgi:MFS transporter, DHA3 family, macrolide efflux protein
VKNDIILRRDSVEDKGKLRKATYHLYTFTISKLISTFGAQVYAFAISFYILQMTGSAVSFAGNLICSILPRTLAGPFAGYIADNYSRKAIVIYSQIATTLAVGGLLVVSISSDLSLTAIYITTSILSLTSMFSGITFTSSITGLVDEARIQKAMSLNQMSMSFATIGSPAIGGLLYGAVSMPVFLIFYIMASIIAVILEATMDFNLFANRTQAEAKDGQKESMLQSIKAGIKYLKLQPILMAIIWISLSINFFFGAFEVGYSFILIEKLKIPSQHFGFTEGAFALGMLLMSIYFSLGKEVKYPLLLSKRALIGMAILVGGVSFPLLVTMSKMAAFIYFMILMLSLGILLINVNTPMQVMLQK